MDITRRRFLAASAGLTALSARTEKPAGLIYRDSARTVAERVEDLLQRMTLEEKLAQLGCVDIGRLHKLGVLDDRGIFHGDIAARALPNGIGELGRPTDPVVNATEVAVIPVREVTERINAIQAFARHQTRLGIPILVHEEATHGLSGTPATQFPSAMALGSSWDRDLLQSVFGVIGREASAIGVGQALAPVLDVLRDPRWGRSDECYGEDPYHVGEIGLAAVRGFQGESLPLAKGKVLVTLKHFAGHGQSQNGTNGGFVDISERTMREVHIPPFAKAIQRGGALSVMCSYNDVSGVPNSASHLMLTEILRDEIGFKGIVLSDYGRVHINLSVARSPQQAAVMALSAGIDIETPNFEMFPLLAAEVQAGHISMDLIDRAVRRMLSVKKAAGLFEARPARPDDAERLIDNAEARTIARRAAERCAVLLRNEGALPLNRTQVRRLAVIGPWADSVYLGGYAGTPRRAISVLQGLRAKLGDAVRVDSALGANITASKPNVAKDAGFEYELPTPADEPENARLTAEAVAAARESDAIILCVGDNNSTAGESWAGRITRDRAELGLVGGQQALYDAVAKLGVPVIVLVFSGRPMALTGVNGAAALIQCWALGQETGTAIADMLFGDVSPGGKLPVSLPRTVGQLPIYYDYRPSGRRNYLFESAAPLYPFGHGLNYSRFEMVGPPSLERTQINIGDNTTVHVDIKNAGDRRADEVVQLYVHAPVSSVTRPIKELAGFERITLNPGERRNVTFILEPEHFSFVGRDMKRVIEPGDFEISVGFNSGELTSTRLTLE